MCRQRLSPVHLFLAVSLSPVMFSAHVTWTQDMSPASKSPAQVSVLAPQSVAVPEGGLRFNPAYGKLSLPFASNKGPPLLGSRSFDVGYLSPLTKNETSNGPWQLTKMEPQAKANQFIGNTPTEWLTYSIPHNTVHYRAPTGSDALQYYGNRLPWAGRVILGVGKQAKFHPRVARVVEVIKPGLSFDKLPRPQRIGK